MPTFMSKINTHVYVDIPFEVDRWKCKSLPINNDDEERKLNWVIMWKQEVDLSGGTKSQI